MGINRRRRSVRTSLAFLGVAATAASTLVVLGSSGAFATSPEILVTAGTSFTANEGAAGTAQLVAKFTDTGNPGGANTDCGATRYTAAIKWGDGSTSAGSVTCEQGVEVPSGTFDVKGAHTYADSGTFTINATVTDTKDQASASGTGTATASIADVALHSKTVADVTGTEGTSLAIDATFLDDNPAFSSSADPALTATVAWGDGTTSAATSIAWLDSSAANVEVKASHVYDANTSASPKYSVTVTLKDDVSSAVDAFSATIADAALTAGTASVTLSATATQSKTVVVGGFTDASSQAAAADYTASIAWGDGTTSAGTVASATTGFNVSGTHTYSSAGSKSITVTVADQEGKTVTLHATATVAAVTLPTTGQPQPTQPALPLIPLVLLAIGLIGIVGASTRILMTRQR